MNSSECMLPKIIAQYYEPSWEVNILKGISIYLGVQSVVLNYSIICFYSRITGSNKIIPFLYKITATFDLLTGVTGFLTAGNFTVLQSDSLNDVLCLPLNNTSGPVILRRILLILSSSTSAFMSSATAFLHTLLTVIRCINISFPFHVVSLINIKRIYWTYLLINASVMLADICYTFLGNHQKAFSSEHYFYYVIFVRVVSLVKYDMMTRGSSTLNFWLHLVFDLFVPFALPCLICMLCLALLVWALNFQKTSADINQTKLNAETQRHITKTIAMLAALFVICNSFYITVIVLQRYFNSQHSTQEWHGKAATLGFCLVPLFNSAVNPLIFICRSTNLKRFTGYPFKLCYVNKFFFPGNGKAGIFAKLWRSKYGLIEQQSIEMKAKCTHSETNCTIVKSQSVNKTEENMQSDSIIKIM